MSSDQLWKVVKLYSLIYPLVEINQYDKYVKAEMKAADFLNSFPSNIVKNVKILQDSNFVLFHNILEIQL